MKKVVVLPPEVARKIAAGEVIDRPNAVLRELLDNAVDSGATSITCEVNGGGIEKIRIIDNGSGMTKEDLELCCEPHATSKISTEADLLTLSTLGFRGEALASIAAVSRLKISTHDSQTDKSWVLENSITEKKIYPGNLAKGTIVESCGIFENFPARRQFLKRESSELAMCRQTFVEKALPRNDIDFRLVCDGKIRLDLKATDSKATRVVEALELSEDVKLFYQLIGKDGDNWNFDLIIGESGVWRKDRKNIHIFVNGRKINEYSLIQAIEYGCEGFFPNGTHPVACLFLNVNSSLVDFNIHPAKREARFKDIASIHKGVSSAVKNFFKTDALTAINNNIHSEPNFNSEKIVFPSASSNTTEDSPKLFNNYETGSYGSSLAKEIFHSDSYNYQKKSFTRDSFSAPSASFKTDSFPNTANSFKTDSSPNTANSFKTDSFVKERPNYDFVYLGMTLGTFLLAEHNNQLYVIDQHAAHERILFNKIMEGGSNRQNLLVPYILETANSAEDQYLESIQNQLCDSGFDITNCGGGTWEITSLPLMWKGTEKDLQTDILENRKEPDQIIRHIAATAACRAAVKDGHVLDADTACEIIDQALKLPDAHCPHGRPIWTVFSKSQLFDLVKRT